ncbi:MAG: FKBP-type peptidyl-prolyl cis-trans isomerase [Nocardioides sp.]
MIRRALSLFLALMLGVALAACGDDSAEPGGETSGGGSSLESVTIEGEPGSDPKVTWDGKLSAGDVESTVISEGDGDEVGSGDQVFAHIWIGNGTTQAKAFSTYDGSQPQLLTVDEKSLSPLFLEGVEGRTIGSRVALSASAETAFGPQGNTSLGIGNKDSILTVIDIISSIGEGAEGKEAKAPGWAPGFEGDAAAPTGFDFAGVPDPTGKLQQATLIEGEGPAVEQGQTIAVDYLGQVFKGEKPFDESFTKNPASFQIGTGGVIKGWDEALVGKNVGSRVVLAIPPDLGYGKEGNKQAGIAGTDTLYFVVDILGAA